MVQLVFPSDTNQYGVLFGGIAIAWMDQAAYVCAARWCRRKAVTAHIDAVDFRRSVPVGATVELIARLMSTGRTSMRMEVEMWAEVLDAEEGPYQVVRGEFVMVALGDDNRPTPVPPFPPQDHSSTTKSNSR
ncbi:MAG: acyl-CoA thioesterase [Chloroflexi bacterium]|nr:acyl-CoA thioesterase [Chloroflexota bacterium]